MLRNNPKTP